MATKDYNARIKNKRDSDLNWSSYNPIILNGELIITDMSNGEMRFKIGDGISTYNQLNGLMLTSNDFTDLLKSNYDNAYLHISKTNNPHNVTKSQLGLENVENKNSATIRSELTKTNVTDALGYTPPTSDTTYGAAGASLGLVKSGGDVSISSGTITVNDDSHNHVISNVDGLQSALDTKGSASDVSNLKTLVGDTPVATQINNAVSSKADLDTNGKVPSSQLPSYVDDVLEYNGKSNFPSTGETGKIYVDIATNLTYRWSGSAYVEISPTLALGETSSTAYRGDRGKIAYDHSQTAHAPSNANYYEHPTYTAKSSGLYKVTVDGTGHVSAATAVAKSDITGLGIPAQDTTYSVATTSANGLMSSTDKTNLDNLKTLVGDTAVSTQISNAVSTKSTVKIVRWS